MKPTVTLAVQRAHTTVVRFMDLHEGQLFLIGDTPGTVDLSGAPYMPSMCISEHRYAQFSPALGVMIYSSTDPLMKVTPLEGVTLHITLPKQ